MNTTNNYENLWVCSAHWCIKDIKGVSNGLCEHLRACEQCVYFCEHEQLLILSFEHPALKKSQMASSEHVNFPPAGTDLS